MISTRPINFTRIQRLEKPHMKSCTTPFTFGGGYKNGGMSNNLVERLNGQCEFDYMGAAEYEFGDVPKSIKHLAESPDKCSGFIDVEGACTFRQGYGKQTPEEAARFAELAPRIGSTHSVRFYTLAPDEAVQDALYKFLPQNAKEDKTPDGTRLDRLWDLSREPETIGWLDIRNHSMFFADEYLFKVFQDILGFTDGQ